MRFRRKKPRVPTVLYGDLVRSDSLRPLSHHDVQPIVTPPPNGQPEADELAARARLAPATHYALVLYAVELERRFVSSNERAGIVLLAPPCGHSYVGPAYDTPVVHDRIYCPMCDARPTVQSVWTAQVLDQWR
jgi:hypothetical protein